MAGIIFCIAIILAKLLLSYETTINIWIGISILLFVCLGVFHYLDKEGQLKQLPFCVTVCPLRQIQNTLF